ncbi:MAG: AAA family ATPase [Candidatus Aenigmatarchaeota archaeon]|nr:MAG: AAA family ATPase [Candidatus Aenigmarchaeota archaeon]
MVGLSIERLEEFLRKHYHKDLLEAVREGRKSIEISYKDLDRFEPALADYLVEKPQHFFNDIQEALKEIDLGVEERPKINIRVKDLPDDFKVRIRDIRSEHIGRFIKVEGVVRRGSEVNPEVETAYFECPDCGAIIEVPQLRKEFTYPGKCECGRQRGFKLVDRKLFDVRWITIEDPFEVSIGEKPGEITVYLKEDLTTPKMQRKTDPGARLEIVGILREMPKYSHGTKTRQMEKLLEANHVKPLEVEYEDIEFTEEDLKKIKELASDPNIYERLVRSLAPSMYGMNEIKEAILLQLFGGVPRTLPDGTNIRGDIHILMVGDPSAGKTQLLKLVSRIIPRGKYVSGKGTTGAGLTATVVRDEEFFGGWVLEAGALVLSNKGILCIDELDKIGKEDQSNLHEAMSTQTVSIAKASIMATLPAQTSILAGANPKLSRFDPLRPIAEQIDIPDTLLSRFDLKFALRDIPNREEDERIVDHIINSRMSEEVIKPEIDTELFRKYIAYAREHSKPEMTKEAMAKLKNFYIDLRSKYSGTDIPTIPITLRQYEALIRLAEASAKIRLDSKVRIEDAERAIKLMKYSIRQLGMDPETGEIDIDRAEGGTPSSQRSKIRIVMDTMDELEKELGKSIPMEDLIAALEEEGIADPEKIIREMKHKGMLFEPRPGFIQKI